jgi:hypothetical protein
MNPILTLCYYQCKEGTLIPHWWATWYEKITAQVYNWQFSFRADEVNQHESQMAAQNTKAVRLEEFFPMQQFAWIFFPFETNH